MTKKKSEENSFVFYRSFYDVINLIPDDAIRGKAYGALCDYAFQGIEPPEDTDTLVKMVFVQAKPQIDANNRRRENGRIGGNASKKTEEANESKREAKNKQPVSKTKQTQSNGVPNVNANANANQNVNENEKENDNVHSDANNLKPDVEQGVRSAGGSRFTPPTITQVEDYIAEKQLDVDAEQFMDYYRAKGWMVGNNPMCDWKAVLRNWNRQEKRHRDKKNNSVNEKGESNHETMERRFGTYL